MSVSNTDEMDEESRSLKSRAQNTNSKIDTTYGIVEVTPKSWTDY